MKRAGTLCQTQGTKQKFQGKPPEIPSLKSHTLRELFTYWKHMNRIRFSNTDRGFYFSFSNAEIQSIFFGYQ